MVIHMDKQLRELMLRYQPYIYKDKREPFPIRFIGCTVFSKRTQSASFPKWVVDPAKENAAMIIEYAIYYDYDIQHLYDLEHIWVGINEAGDVIDCWCSFHGMRLRAAGVSMFRMDGNHPVLYSQPGKHAMLPQPELFELHPDFRDSCMSRAGGGILLPALLNGAVETNARLDAEVAAYIRANFTFEPSMEFIREVPTPEQFISWPELLERIPKLIAEQVCVIKRLQPQSCHRPCTEAELSKNRPEPECRR